MCKSVYQRPAQYHAISSSHFIDKSSPCNLLIIMWIWDCFIMFNVFLSFYISAEDPNAVLIEWFFPMLR